MQIGRFNKFSSHISAFTLVEIMIISAILGLLVFHRSPLLRPAKRQHAGEHLSTMSGRRQL